MQQLIRPLKKQTVLLTNKNKIMKTSALLKLHQRQVDILDMIVKAENNRKSFERDGYIYRQKTDSRWYGSHLEHIDKVVLRYAAIKERLIRYYLDIQGRINDLQPKKEISQVKADIVTQSLIS